jgi:protein phosphatase
VQNKGDIVTHETDFRWTSAANTHVGLVRKINEDACLDLPARGLWAVADGMGGHALGDFASRTVIESLSALPAPASLAQFTADAHDSLQAANRLLRAEAAQRGAQVIGSTVVVLLVCGRLCCFLWAGDSRLYLYRNGRMQQITRDHSQIEELISLGNLSEEEAAHLPGRSLITRAIGAADTLEIDEEGMEVRDGDIFLLCSDGLSNAVSEQDMAEAIAAHSCRQATETLIDLALKGGGRDNISAVVVHAEDPAANDQTVLNPAL